MNRLFGALATFWVFFGLGPFLFALWVNVQLGLPVLDGKPYAKDFFWMPAAACMIVLLVLKVRSDAQD